MASAGPSATPTPSSAWSRLVQITRTASESSRSKASEAASPLDSTLSDSYTSSSTAPPKKRRQVESPPARSVTKYLAPLSPQRDDLPNMSPGKSKKHICCSPNNSHNNCITACPCGVEDVDCVASQESGDNTRQCLPRSGRQMAKSDDDSDQEPTQPKTRKALRRGPLERARNSSPRPDEFKTKRNTKSTHLGEQAIPRDLGASTEFAEEVSASSSCGSANLEDHDTVALIILEPEQAAEKGTLSTTGAGLHEGDQNSINKTPVPRRHSSPPTSSDETIQLATPSSSPAVQTASKTNQAPVEATKPFEPAAAPKMKRRLTLHGDSYERQPSQKKRKAAPKRKDGVQTTLSLAIGSSAGMRECKLCDTVYNPLHPEDVKVHTKRHAIAVKRDRVSEEISGLAGSTLAD